MFSLAYVSSATKLFSTEDLRELLATCDRNNRPADITGMLLYKDGNFMQVLEGAEASVRVTHERISSDPRHKGLLTLLQGEIPARQFGAWTMGFKHLHPTTVLPAAYSEFLTSSLTSSEFLENPSRAHKLLMMFRQSM